MKPGRLNNVEGATVVLRIGLGVKNLDVTAMPEKFGGKLRRGIVSDDEANWEDGDEGSILLGEPKTSEVASDILGVEGSMLWMKGFSLSASGLDFSYRFCRASAIFGVEGSNLLAKGFNLSVSELMFSLLRRLANIFGEHDMRR